jgi:hypothetical protein
VLVVAYLTLIEIVKVIFDRREAQRPEAIARRSASPASRVRASGKPSGAAGDARKTA